MLSIYVYRIARGSINTRRIFIHWTRVSTVEKPTQYGETDEQRIEAAHFIAGESITNLASGEDSHY